MTDPVGPREAVTAAGRRKVLVGLALLGIGVAVTAFALILPALPGDGPRGFLGLGISIVGFGIWLIGDGRRDERAASSATGDEPDASSEEVQDPAR